LTSVNYLDSNSSGNFSNDINGLASNLIGHRNTELSDLLLLIEEGRRLTTNIKQCLLYYIYCVSWMHSLLFVSYILFPGPLQILNGIQLLYILGVIAPLLSIVLLFLPKQHDLMDILPDKNIIRRKRISRAFFNLFTRFTASVIVSIILFIW
jgi:magnesium-transporting ATPase (P-type)